MIDNGFIIGLIVVLLIITIIAALFLKSGEVGVVTEVITSEDDPALAAESERRSHVVNKIINQASYWWGIPEEELKTQPIVNVVSTFENKSYISIAYQDYYVELYANWKWNLIKVNASVINNNELLFHRSGWFRCGRTLNYKRFRKLFLKMFDINNPLTEDDIYNLPRVMEEIFKKKRDKRDVVVGLFEAYVDLMAKLIKHPNDRRLRTIYHQLTCYIMKTYPKEFRNYLGIEEKMKDKQ